jgi:hypothetical protein
MARKRMTRPYRQCPCGGCYWCYKCKRWVPNHCVCGTHQATLYDRGLQGRVDG